VVQKDGFTKLSFTRETFVRKETIDFITGRALETGEMFLIHRDYDRQESLQIDWTSFKPIPNSHGPILLGHDTSGRFQIRVCHNEQDELLAIFYQPSFKKRNIRYVIQASLLSPEEVVKFHEITEVH